MALRIPSELTSLTEHELAELIKQATAEELRLSHRRNKLQDRLDFLRSGGGAGTEAYRDLREKLVADEQRASDERKAMHQLIDDLHAERARRTR